MVAGAFCGGWAFEEMAPPLEAAGWRTRPLDMPGQGPGDPPPVLVSVTDCAEAVARAARACARPPVLVGHSMGGLVVQLAAARAPVAGLVLMSPSPAWGQPISSPVELAASPALVALHGPYWMQTVEPIWEVMRSHTLDRLTPGQARAHFARMRPESGRALYEVLTWWADPTMAASVPPLNVPALVLTGELDRVHAPSTTEVTAARLRAPQVVLPGVSHWTLGGPGADAGVRAVAEWLETL